MTAIRSNRYADAVRVLVDDAVCIAMADEMFLGVKAGLISLEPGEGYLHDDGTPTSRYMTLVNDRYTEQGGTNQAHLGAVAEAVTQLVAAKAAHDLPAITLICSQCDTQLLVWLPSRNVTEHEATCPVCGYTDVVNVDPAAIL